MAVPVEPTVLPTRLERGTVRIVGQHGDDEYTDIDHTDMDERDVKGGCVITADRVLKIACGSPAYSPAGREARPARRC